MLAVLSPAKTLDFATPSPTRKHSLPVLLDDSKLLIDALRTQAPADLAQLMNMSTKLADQNYQRYTDWHTPFTSGNAKQAALAFKGDVYLGMDAATFSERDFTWAQKHLRILSGLHGILKPLDLIQPYRLEMGTRLKTGRGDDLYQFWGEKITDELNADLATQKRPMLINLASNEYFDAIDASRLNARIITPTFKDLKNGKYRFMSFFAKRARGMMASYLVKNRVNTLKALREFDWGGYYYSEDLSRGDDWVFLRDKPA
ncbi:MAG: peroxide stress protein YaaA [Pseudomonadales bacterium]|nr:peroxide stress protein YaaA [Pseudomonadales bacterium]NIX08430.1 peroxide stress protein YaaA [Pseudomonadales bacterium]